MSAADRPHKLWQTTPMGSARMAALGDRIVRCAREDIRKAWFYLVSLAKAERPNSGETADSLRNRENGTADVYIPSLEEMDRLFERCELFRRLERVPISSPHYLPRLPIGMFSPREIQSKIEYVARLCILDNHGRLPEPVGLINMMMDRNEEGTPGRNFFIGDRETYTWNCLSWWHFPPGYLEELEQQQPRRHDEPGFEVLPKLTVEEGGGKKLIGWIVRRVAERDFQPDATMRVPAASFLAKPLDQDTVSASAIPMEWTCFTDDQHILDYADLSEGRRTAIDGVIKAHPSVSAELLRIFLAMTEGVDSTISHIEGVRAAMVLDDAGNAIAGNADAERTEMKVAQAGNTTITYFNLWDSIWEPEEDLRVYEPRPAWQADARVSWARRAFVGIMGHVDWEQEEEEGDFEVPRPPITRSRCAISTCLFAEEEYEMRWETDPRDMDVVMCQFHSRTVSILRFLGWTDGMIDIALVNSHQLPDAANSDDRLLDRVFSFVVCGHPTCEGLGLPFSGIYPDPIGIELGVCGPCRANRDLLLQSHGGNRQQAVTHAQALCEAEDCASCSRSAAAAGGLSWIGGRDDFGYANKDGRTLCHRCFTQAGGIECWEPSVNPWDIQAIRDCVNEMLERNERMSDLLPRFSWMLLEDKNVGIPVRGVRSVIRRAAGLPCVDC